MIAYEDLCVALDRYNRRLRGEQFEEPSGLTLTSAEFDIVDEVPVATTARELGAGFGPDSPDITAETRLPEAGYDPQYQQQGYDPQHQQQGYDPQHQQQGYDPQYQQQGYDPQHQQQGYDPSAYPQQGQPPVPGSGPVPGHGGYDPNRQ